MITQKHITAAIASLLIVGGALPAFAQTSISVSTGAAAGTNGAGVSAGATAAANTRAANAAARRVQVIAHAADKANQEITRRINALGALSTRVNAMVRLSADEKTGLSSEITDQVNAMNEIKARIAADETSDSTSTLKADIQSITKAYRIFALIIPQGAINAAADRIMTVVGTANGLGAKLQARIAAAQSSGNDTTAAASAMADMTAKVADANTQAEAAVSETASLKPDNGDQTVMQSNAAALKDARAKIQAAQKDIVAARADAKTIVQAIGKFKVSAGASASTSAAGQ